MAASNGHIDVIEYLVTECKVPVECVADVCFLFCCLSHTVSNGVHCIQWCSLYIYRVERSLFT